MNQEKRDFWRIIVTAALLVAAMVAVAVLCGCKSSGVRVVASSRSIMSVGDINWDEYKIPVFSLYSGPHLTLWVNKDFLYLKDAKAYGSVTNDVAALGIYSSKENKAAGIDLHFGLVNTNTVSDAVAP